MSDVPFDKDLIARLRSQRFELNKLSVIEFLESFLSTRGVGHLCDPESAAYIRKDGSPVTCQADWLSDHDKYADRVQFEKEKNLIVRALQCAMGSEFNHILQTEVRADGTVINPVKIMLPHQIWDRCKKRLEEQHFDGGSNLKNDLHALEYEVGDDMAKFQEEFLNLANQICYEDPNDLNDSESIPILLDNIKGWRKPNHPYHHPCQLISDDFDKQKRSLRLNPSGPRPLTLVKAMDRLRKHYNELQKLESKDDEETALTARAAAINLLEGMNYRVVEPEHFGLAANPTRGHTNSRWERGVQLDMARAQHHTQNRGGGGGWPTSSSNNNRGGGGGGGRQYVDLPFRGQHNVCHKCGSSSHTEWRSCPLLLRNSTGGGYSRNGGNNYGGGGGNFSSNNNLQEVVRRQQQQIDQLIQMMQGNHRGSASGMMAAGAPDEHLPVPSAMYGTTYRMDPNNQPTFVPGDEEKAGVEPRAAWGDDSEDEDEV